MKNRFVIVCFGNSITEAKIGVEEPRRWPKLLEYRLGAAFPGIRFSVVNSGVGGNSAREAMARFDRDVLSHAPDFVILEFGGNNNDPSNPARRVPPDEFRVLLERFLVSLPPETVVLVVTFPPVHREAHAYWQNPAFMDYLWESEKQGMGIGSYVAITRDFAAAHGLEVFDLNARLTELAGRDGWQVYTLPDGIHLTETGNQVLADGVFELLHHSIEEKTSCR